MFSWFRYAWGLGSCCWPAVNLLTGSLFQAKLFHLPQKNIKKCHLAEIPVTYLAGLNWSNYTAHTFHSRYLKHFTQCNHDDYSRRSIFSAPVRVSEEPVAVIKGRVIISPDWWVSRGPKAEVKTSHFQKLHSMTTPYSLTVWCLCAFFPLIQRQT